MSGKLLLPLIWDILNTWWCHLVLLMPLLVYVKAEKCPNNSISAPSKIAWTPSMQLSVLSFCYLLSVIYEKKNGTLTKLAFKWLAPDGKLNPCGFFSQHLCCWKEIWCREMWATGSVMLPLDKCKCWLEGIEQLFIFWRGHKNLSYCTSGYAMMEKIV